MEEEECVCDFNLDASLNSSLEWDNKHFTSTPTKMATTNLESYASSPVSFLGPNYSALSVEDSVSERSVDETLSTADIPSSTSSFGISHPQLVVPIKQNVVLSPSHCRYPLIPVLVLMFLRSHTRAPFKQRQSLVMLQLCHI